LRVEKFDGKGHRNSEDPVAVEEPLEFRIRVGGLENRKTRSLAVTMRTPGNDFELGVGFLVSEGIVHTPDEIQAVSFQPPFLTSDSESNIVEIELDPTKQIELSKLQRHFYLTSSCGICGRASLDIIRADGVEPFPDSGLKEWEPLRASLIRRIADQLQSKQPVFQLTGGLHGASLVSESGEWIAVREDVGRHNAVDKLIGSQFLQRNFPLTGNLLVLSGRASFELMQKALLARIPTVIAIGAPSTLAVELAREFRMTLVGFAGSERFNVYSGSERILFDS
jgi:FdhD protein